MNPVRTLLADFEAGRVAPEAFGHRQHLRVAWALLAGEGADFADAYVRLRFGLKGVCARAGKPERYSETATLAWLSLVHEAAASAPDAVTFEAFEAVGGPALARDSLGRLYPHGELATPAARAGLILPRGRR